MMSGNDSAAIIPGPGMLVASTAGATRHLFDDPANAGLYTPADRGALEHDRRYRHVFRTLLPP